MANSIRAKVHGQTSFEEGAADEELEPGQGCVVFEEDGQTYVRSAEADERTSRVVRERRNPPAFDSDVESPLGHGYDEGDNVETLGFKRFDQFRGILADGEAGDEVGWNADGELTATEVDTPIGNVREVLDDGFAVIEVN